MQRQRQNSQLRQNVAIIGGGVGGCCTALELAKTGQFNIYLLEKNHELMRESSDATPGRLGLGFHYSDKTTALHFLHVTVDFTKRYGQFRQEIGRNQSHPLRRGRYFVVKNSLVPIKHILDVYEAIKEEYTKMVRDDPSCEVFGPPEDIYRVLQPQEFEADVEMEKIEMGIETAEELLDWARLREFLIDQLEKKVNFIKVLRNTKAVMIRAHDHGYVIDGINIFHGGAVKISADLVVNASWYNISKFNNMLDISSACR